MKIKEARHRARQYNQANYRFVYFEDHKKHGKLAVYQSGDYVNGFNIIRCPVKYLVQGELTNLIRLGRSY